MNYKVCGFDRHKVEINEDDTMRRTCEGCSGSGLQGANSFGGGKPCEGCKGMGSTHELPPDYLKMQSAAFPPGCCGEPDLECENVTVHNV